MDKNSEGSSKVASVSFEGSHQYANLSTIYGFSKNKPVKIGRKIGCRYCGEKDMRAFRKVAHSFPEFLGNKNVVSIDECDRCNEIFSVYETALADYLLPLLTLGGIKGKGNKIPQTGRTEGPIRIINRGGEGSNLHFHMNVNSFEEHIRVNPLTRQIQLQVPVPIARFRPRHAYKALVKMALAFLPEDELRHYSKLINWICNPNDHEDFHYLEVVMSHANVFNPPPVVSGTLLKRQNDRDEIPYILFLFVAGAVCFQIDLMSDHMEDHLPPRLPNSIKISWKATMLGERDGEKIVIDYQNHRSENWASLEKTERPFKEFGFTVDL